MTGNTFAHWQSMKTNRATYNILDTDVGTADEDNNADEENSRIHKGWEPVFAFVPVALAEKLEPHHGGEVKGEAGDEKGGAESQEVVEEGNSFSDDPGDDSDDGDETQPSGPPHGCVDVSNH